MEDKAIKIAEEILEKTAYCEHDFSCLSGARFCTCADNRSIGYGMLEVILKNGDDCKYHVTFGDTSFCTCPTRVEIYKQYSI